MIALDKIYDSNPQKDSIFEKKILRYRQLAISITSRYLLRVGRGMAKLIKSEIPEKWGPDKLLVMREKILDFQT